MSSRLEIFTKCSTKNPSFEKHLTGSDAKLFVIPNGYAGLYNLIEFNSLIQLNEERAELFTSVLAGSEAGHSRVKIKKLVHLMLI